MNIILCDDNKLHLDHALSLTKSCLSDTPADIRCYTSAEEIENLAKCTEFIPDIAILDIELDNNNGIHLAQLLNQRFPRCQIIFLSAFPAYASDVYQVPHVWFVLKNRIKEFLPQALNKAVAALSGGNQTAYVILKHNHISRRMELDHIYYLERKAHQTRVVTANDYIDVWQAPSELLGNQGENAFIRCHQSYWINPAKITAYANNSFHLLNGAVIPISRTYKKSALDLFRNSAVSTT